MFQQVVKYPRTALLNVFKQGAAVKAGESGHIIDKTPGTPDGETHSTLKCLEDLDGDT